MLAAATKRYLLIVLGWSFVVLGVVGAFLPVLPTTPFLLIALWAFARSSGRFHAWLYHHPQLGPPLQRWEQHGVIPLRVKFLSVGAMAVSLVYVVGFSGAPWPAVGGMALFIAYGAWFVLSRPSLPRKIAE
ncbi:MAG: YbaN family protein [Magnetospirillum sp. WYHS-4]